MICLDKADERAFKHLSWNQSPPALAANHTTCEDLNGISNLREHVKACQAGAGGGGCGGCGGCGLFDSAAPDDIQHCDGREGAAIASLRDAGRFMRSSSHLGPASVGRKDAPIHLSLASPSPSPSSSVWGWLKWLASVFVAACVMSALMPRLDSLSSSASLPIAASSKHVADEASASSLVAPTSPFGHEQPARLHRRSTCETGGVSSEEFNMPLHGCAILIIWFVSTSACGFPILAAKVPGMRIPSRFFFAVRHFGTGVLIATAFVHLLPTAFLSLGDPCLGSFFTTDYPALPGAIALAAIFFVVIIEMIFHPCRQMPADSNECSGNDIDPESTAVSDAPLRITMAEMRPPIRGRSSSIGRGLAQLNQVEPFDIQPSSTAHQDERPLPKQHSSLAASETSSQHVLSEEQKRRKERLQCVMLEMGILFHSIFIGMALSVSIGNSFIILLIAIIFHQMFEGLALGSRVAVVNWAEKKWQPWLMALAYGFTTPIGQAIGLATHQLYSPGSEIGLIVVGVMNAISAGLLTFASLVELLSEDFLSDESWQYLRGTRRVCACMLVFAGAFLMSLVGAWA
ncbi:hypothetical protein S7711_07874 [Stachybotrys chartarum IBT 7711]|uniref:Uncharacterized protein n=1 Tax=Stachybotrys chartarum (strain CBS 109288 / IBT 7711) TaxID=1280523 RepID=A0A084AJZ6_STACB|nr:hypothetical protein S7711_07874 [Stachybotrys chartarum IBT 7711]